MFFRISSQLASAFKHQSTKKKTSVNTKLFIVNTYEDSAEWGYEEACAIHIDLKIIGLKLFGNLSSKCRHFLQ